MIMKVSCQGVQSYAHPFR